MTTEIPAAQHSPTCAVFGSGHEQSRDGKPGRFRPIPCDCYQSRA